MRGDIQLKKRHQPSGFNSRFEGDSLTFSDYIAGSRKMLAQVHDGAANMEKIVDGNAPFELMPSINDSAGKNKTCRRGVLLTHGLTDSPYFMRTLADFFQQNGFRVMAVLLPGHGTQPGDLLQVRWRDWADAVSYGTDRLAEEVDEIYLAGYSAGATLSFYQSSYDERVRGLFLFSPALKVSARAAWANLHRLYSWLIPSAKWVGIKPDLDIYKYESFPKNAAAQMHGLTQAVRSKHGGIQIPVFSVASGDDATVDVSATLELMRRADHPSSRLVYYSTDPDHMPTNIAEDRLEVVNSAVPGQKILCSAHTAIVLPPEDVHYGIGGEYANCIHYFPEQMERYEACINRPGDMWQGEITEGYLQAGTLRRLMYNPNFDALKLSLRRFIESLP